MTKKRIPQSEVEWIPSSTADAVGRVFLWKSNIYRAIRKSKSQFYSSLIQKEIFKKLSLDGGLVGTHKTNYLLPNFSLILKQQKITFPSYPFEWPGEMLKSAALEICDLSLELEKYNLELKDAHPYNVMFENYHPKFIDIGSITQKYGNKWNLSKAFKLNLLYPLYCISKGKSEYVRFLFRNELEGNILTQKISQLTPFRYKFVDKLLALKTSNSKSSISHFRNEIKKIKLKSQITDWSSYSHDVDYFLPFDRMNRWFAKQKNIYQILEKLRPSTVIDIGSNIGWYAELAARLGAKVVATDIDESSLNQLYFRTKETKLPILPLLVDFMKSQASNIAWPAAWERLRCDMVLALAISHHLVFKNHLYFDTIAQELNKFSKKWLIIEFIPPHDKYIKNWLGEEHYWYSLNNFHTSLHKFFNKIEILDSAPAPRKLLLCQK